MFKKVRCNLPVVVVSCGAGGVFPLGNTYCADLAVIQPNAYPLPVYSEVMVAISSGKVFTKLDLRQAYQQLRVDDFTSNTHKGLFREKRLPFVSAAPGIFQKFMENLLRGIPGVRVFLDDIIVSGKDADTHDKNLECVLDKFCKRKSKGSGVKM